MAAWSFVGTLSSNKHMKTMMMTPRQAGWVLAAFVALAPAVSSHAMYDVSDTGLWPTNWPRELEPLRKQSRTLRHDQYTMYEIPFTSRQQFQAVWPHILAVKSPEAPIILLKGPNDRLGKTIKAGVRRLSSARERLRAQERPLRQACPARDLLLSHV